ncbi:hypothetical protein Gohar_010525 [Gossypium harknessii]|uniref:Dihydrolipoyl dehydrogenase n=1 Tax=Gossypium harknessii TaxID=34285 RepID=A0A7J9GR83_9ROSI|nr:hypothetical protein [Gossypium harknessii]
MPGFDPEISKLAQRVLINPRKIDYHTGITPARDGKPVIVELTDAKTKEHKDTLEVDAALIATGRAPFTYGLGLENINVVTQRGFVPVDERMRVIDANGNLVPHLYCIGDANGKMMLAHAASAQGISVVEQVTGRDHVLNHLSVPAACFTHPEISMVGLTETDNVDHDINIEKITKTAHETHHKKPQAREKAEKEGFEISVAKTSFKANTKALAENEGEGLAKLIYRPDNGEILGVHIFGLHAADLIHEASNAVALGTRIQDIRFAVHAHPTLSEVLDELFKSAKDVSNMGMFKYFEVFPYIGGSLDYHMHWIQVKAPASTSSPISEPVAAEYQGTSFPSLAIDIDSAAKVGEEIFHVNHGCAFSVLAAVSLLVW